ncbi:MAG: hypothetical protein WC712_05335 [Candidatus Brocadiia bacterium]
MVAEGFFVPVTLLWGVPSPQAIELSRDLCSSTDEGTPPQEGDFSTAISYAPRNVVGVRRFTVRLSAPISATRYAGILLRGVRIESVVSAPAQDGFTLQGNVRLAIDGFDSDPGIYPPPAPIRLREVAWSWTMPHDSANLQLESGDLFLEWEWSDRMFAAFQISLETGITATRDGTAMDPPQSSISAAGMLSAQPGIIMARKCSRVWR